MFKTTQKRKKACFSALISLVLVFQLSSVLFVPAEAVSQSELNALKQQQSALADQKADLQSKSDALNDQVSSQSDKLTILTARVNVTKDELKNLSDQISYYTNSIAKMENDLNVNQQKELQLEQKYKTRIRAMEESGSTPYIAILFGARSFSDLLDRIECISEIMEYDNGLVKNVQDAQVKTASAKSDMEKQMAEQETVFASYQQKQADLLVQQNEAAAVLTSLKVDSADYQKQLDSVKTLQSSISGQITDMQNKLEEQERLRAEQAAASKASSGSGSYYGEPLTGSGTGQDIVNFAETFLGVPYVYGGTDPSGFDCSGLVYYCYRHFGYAVNRTATSLSYNGHSVSRSELKPGDIIIFTESDSSDIGHCGIYVGNGEFIHAPHTGDVVKISDLNSEYYDTHYWGARRVID